MGVSGTWIITPPTLTVGGSVWKNCSKYLTKHSDILIWSEMTLVYYWRSLSFSRLGSRTKDKLQQASDLKVSRSAIGSVHEMTGDSYDNLPNTLILTKSVQLEWSGRGEGSHKHSVIGTTERCTLINPTFVDDPLKSVDWDTDFGCTTCIPITGPVIRVEVLAPGARNPPLEPCNAPEKQTVDTTGLLFSGISWGEVVGRSEKQRYSYEKEKRKQTQRMK